MGSKNVRVSALIEGLRTFKDFKDFKVFKVFKVFRVFRVFRVFKDFMDFRVNKVIPTSLRRRAIGRRPPPPSPSPVSRKRWPLG